ncbi:MAG: GGDEF domain-containing protein [Pseudolabrys sp.]
MFASDTLHPAALDIRTIVFVAVLVAAVLGLFMILAWMQDRTTRALAWCGAAYLIGGSAVLSWGTPAPRLPIPEEYCSALIFVACGMVWNGVRLFQGRRRFPSLAFAGATLWLLLMQIPEVAASESVRSTLAGLLVAAYTFGIAFDLWSDRRQSSYSRTAAIVVPALHAAIFLFPIFMRAWQPATSANGWTELFALETVLYAVGVAFIVLLMVKDRSVLIYRHAATTDHLTGLLNRRAFFEGAASMCVSQRKQRAPVTVFVFDLDHFKSINDRFGHGPGDDVLRVFAASLRSSMRAEDIVGRLGGEEFAAIVPNSSPIAGRIAARVREAFEKSGAVVAGKAIGATVSIGAACADAADADIEALVERADVALYRAKHNGRNRVAFADDLPADAARTIAAERAQNRRAAAMLSMLLRRKLPP